MNPWRALLMPWQIIHRRMRWLVLLLLVTVVTGTAVFALVSGKPDMWVRVTIMIAAVEAVVWLICFPKTALLTIDAHQLRVPGINRRAVAGVMLNGALGVLLPAAIIGWVYGHAIAVAVLVALMSMGSVLYKLLPRIAGVALYVAFLTAMTTDTLKGWLLRADFSAWGVLVLILGLASIDFCWRRVILAPDPYEVSWSSLPMLRLRRGLSTAVAGRSTIGRLDRPAWLQEQPDLRGCGPGHPVRSLRMALGGAGMPLTAMGWLRKSIGALQVIAVFALVLLLLNLRDGVDYTPTFLWDSGILAGLLAGAPGLCVLLAIGIPNYLRARWRMVNAEVPLLALLPGLGSNVKSDLLQAALLPALRLLLVAAVLVLVATTRVHQLAPDMFAWLVVATAAVNVVAFTLRRLGGITKPRMEDAAAVILGLALLAAGLLAVFLSLASSHSGPGVELMWHALLIGWLIEVVMLFRVARRGWRGLQSVPHPFLAH